jgi:hypothetical protein
MFPKITIRGGITMGFEPTDKEKVIEFLMAARRQAQLAEVSLRFQGKPDEAEKIWERNTRLSAEIDILIGRIMEEWLAAADRVIKKLTAINAKLETTIADIKRKIDVAQNVVKVVGFLDDAVGIAKKIIAGG